MRNYLKFYINGRWVDPVTPWQVTNHYPSDKATLLQAPIDDGILRFERRQADLRTA